MEISSQHLLEFHEKSKAAATMCVRDYDYHVPYGVIEGNGHEVINIEEKPLHSFFVNAGIYIVEPKIVRSLIKNEYIDMTTLLGQKIEQDDKVLMFPIHEYWLDIGRIEDLKKAQIDFETLDL